MLLSQSSTVQAGSNVILAARRADALKAVADACVAAHKESGVQGGGKFATVQLDVADKKQIASFFDRVPEDLRKVDVLGKHPLTARRAAANTNKQ